MSEHGIQNRIRNALAGVLPLFRANVGRGWTGQKVLHVRQRMVVPVEPGDVVISQARPFDTGLPEGFSDTFGVLRVTITPDMVGQHIGQAVFGEVKDATGRVGPRQAAFLSAMRNHGALAGVWRSPDDALAMLGRKAEK